MSSYSTKGNQYQKKEHVQGEIMPVTQLQGFFSLQLDWVSSEFVRWLFTRGSKQHAWFWEHSRGLWTLKHPCKHLNKYTGRKLSEAVPVFHSTAHQEGHNEASWWVATVHLEGVSGFWAKRQKRDPKGRLCPWPSLPSLVLIFIGPSAL